MKPLPSDLQSYKRTAVFQEDSIPKGLLRDHSTKIGVWARIVIEQGTLEYTILEPFEQSIILTPDQPGVIEPTVTHRIKPLGEVRLYIEFFR